MKPPPSPKKQIISVGLASFLEESKDKDKKKAQSKKKIEDSKRKMSGSDIDTSSEVLSLLLTILFVVNCNIF